MGRYQCPLAPIVSQVSLGPRDHRLCVLTQKCPDSSFPIISPSYPRIRNDTSGLSYWVIFRGWFPTQIHRLSLVSYRIRGNDDLFHLQTKLLGLASNYSQTMIPGSQGDPGYTHFNCVCLYRFSTKNQRWCFQHPNPPHTIRYEDPRLWKR